MIVLQKIGQLLRILVPIWWVFLLVVMDFRAELQIKVLTFAF
jgi:hypothetical protein